MLDNECYYLNVSDANLTNEPKWQLEYAAKVSLCAYNLAVNFSKDQNQ